MSVENILDFRFAISLETLYVFFFKPQSGLFWCRVGRWMYLAVIFELSNKILYFIGLFFFFFFFSKMPAYYGNYPSSSAACIRLWQLALLPKLSNRTFPSRFRFANTPFSLILDAARALRTVGGRFMFKRSCVLAVRSWLRNVKSLQTLHQFWSGFELRCLLPSNASALPYQEQPTREQAK